MQRAKNQFARDYILSRQSIKDKASQLGHAEVIQKDMASADGEFDTFLKVTTDDIKRVARKYFTPENRLVLRVMPLAAEGRKRAAPPPLRRGCGNEALRDSRRHRPAGDGRVWPGGAVAA